MEEERGHTVEQESATEVRCLNCGHFLCQLVLVEGKTVIKVVCRSCKDRLLLTLTPGEVIIGQV
jgi:ribosomal protein S27E